MSRVVEEGSVPVPQRQLGTDQTFSGTTSIMVAVSSRMGITFSGMVPATLPAVPAGTQHFSSGMRGHVATE